MKARREQMTVRYEDIGQAEGRDPDADPAARDAVYEFLRFQIREHRPATRWRRADAR